MRTQKIKKQRDNGKEKDINKGKEKTIMIERNNNK